MKVENVNASPPAAPAAPASAPGPAGVSYVTAEDGRRFGLKKLKPSQRYQLSEVVDAKTQSATMQLITAASVVSIDDEGFPLIASRAELLKMLDEIGDEGLLAIMAPVMAMYGADLSAKDIETAKN